MLEDNHHSGRKASDIKPQWVQKHTPLFTQIEFSSCIPQLGSRPPQPPGGPETMVYFDFFFYLIPLHQSSSSPLYLSKLPALLNPLVLSGSVAFSSLTETCRMAS